MTNEQIVEMAKQAGLGRETPDDYFVAVWSANPTTLQRFAQLVRNATLDEAYEECLGVSGDFETADECRNRIRNMKL